MEKLEGISEELMKGAFTYDIQGQPMMYVNEAQIKALSALLMKHDHHIIDWPGHKTIIPEENQCKKKNTSIETSCDREIAENGNILAKSIDKTLTGHVHPKDEGLLKQMINQPPKLARVRRAYFNGINPPWPKGIIHYIFSDAAHKETKDAALDAMKKIMQRVPCIKFVPVTPTSDFVAYLLITDKRGRCYAQVAGYREGPTIVNLSYPECTQSASAVHEFMHILGLEHEQKRPDRDDYVEINWSNIEEKKRHNFDMSPWPIDENAIGEYDYLSRMHYRPDAFHINHEIPTIKVRADRDGFLSKWGNKRMSRADYIGLRERYGCPGELKFDKIYDRDASQNREASILGELREKEKKEAAEKLRQALEGMTEEKEVVKIPGMELPDAELVAQLKKYHETKSNVQQKEKESIIKAMQQERELEKERLRVENEQKESARRFEEQEEIEAQKREQEENERKQLEQREREQKGRRLAEMMRKEKEMREQKEMEDQEREQEENERKQLEQRERERKERMLAENMRMKKEMEQKRERDENQRKQLGQREREQKEREQKERRLAEMMRKEIEEQKEIEDQEREREENKRKQFAQRESLRAENEQKELAQRVGEQEKIKAQERENERKQLQQREWDKKIRRLAETMRMEKEMAKKKEMVNRERQQEENEIKQLEQRQRDQKRKELTELMQRGRVRSGRRRSQYRTGRRKGARRKGARRKGARRGYNRRTRDTSASVKHGKLAEAIMRKTVKVPAENPIILVVSNPNNLPVSWYHVVDGEELKIEKSYTTEHTSAGNEKIVIKNSEQYDGNLFVAEIEMNQTVLKVFWSISLLS